MIALITGLGFTFSGSSKKARLLNKITKRMYSFALRKNKVTIFQNKDDEELFLNNSILNSDQETYVVNGSGVNLNEYPFRPNKRVDQKIKFVIVARLIREKGIELFLRTAKELKNKFPLCEFHIVGGQADPPSGINMQSLLKLEQEQIIYYHGLKDNIAQFLSEMDVFVLPTFYREGVPRSILEALSIGMPIITTDTPGCRETVIKGQNGFLIPPKDENALKEACQRFIDNPMLIEQMGSESRNLAERKFDVNIINDHLLKKINEFS